MKHDMSHDIGLVLKKVLLKFPVKMPQTVVDEVSHLKHRSMEQETSILKLYQI
jgi:hypothetical protein